METVVVYEIIGYLASVLVAISLMMSRIVPLRIVNLIGSATFTLYGYLIGSWPVAGMNFFIVLINIYYLVQIYNSREYLRILEVSKADEFLRYFLGFHKTDIQQYHPGFEEKVDLGELNMLVLRDTVPAGAVSGEMENGRLTLNLDFVTPQYRDFKIANFLYAENKDYFREKGIKEIAALPADSKYATYLKKVGFNPENGSSGMHVLKL